MGEGRYQSVLLELAALDKRDTEQALRRILRLDAETLGIERVNFWTLGKRASGHPVRAGLRTELVEPTRAARAFSVPTIPIYFRALRKSKSSLPKMLDAILERRSSPSSISHAFGIGAMLDVPVWVEGRLAGVLCHEHVGPPRKWELSEREFGTAIAQLIATTLEVRERQRAEERTTGRRGEEQPSRGERSIGTRTSPCARRALLGGGARALHAIVGIAARGGCARHRSRHLPCRYAERARADQPPSQRMTQLVSNLLDVSRIQAQKIHLSFERTNLRQLVEDVAERFDHVLVQANCTLQIEQNGEVVGIWDKSRLDQVITNLLSNAVKFGKGAPYLDFQPTSGADGGALAFAIAASAFRRTSLPHIFDRFERAVPRALVRRTRFGAVHRASHRRSARRNGARTEHARRRHDDDGKAAAPPASGRRATRAERLKSEHLEKPSPHRLTRLEQRLEIARKSSSNHRCRFRRTWRRPWPPSSACPRPRA